MKGGKRRNSISDQIHLQSTPEPSSTVNVGGDLMREDEGGNKREESEKFVSADEGLDEGEREEGDSEADLDYEEPEEEEEEKVKLADGYYEIEAVRGKRIRKGQRQYLIKWREWPESANTWEPYQNLKQVADVIEAFEESLKAGKSTRKRKRKPSINHVLPKKKHREQHQRSPSTAAYSVPPRVARMADETTNFSTLNESVMRDEIIEVNANGVNSDEMAKQLSENGVNMVSAIASGPSELGGEMATTIESGVVAALPSGESQQAVVEPPVIEPVQPPRYTGAKRRKSGSVRRFRQEPLLEDVQIGEASYATSAPTAVQPTDFLGNNGSCNDKHEDSHSSCTITKIVKPISYRASTSEDVHDILLAFEALRSDGTKVTVDNKFLKANNPLLLIDYYERNLKYNTTQ